MREETFWSWLRTVRLSRLICVFVPCFIFAPILTYWWLTTSLQTSSVLDRDSADVARKVLGLIDFDHLSGPELKNRIDELLRIKGSVQAELQNLEKKRQVMLTDLSDLTRTIEGLKAEASKEIKELDKLRASIQQTRLSQLDLIQRNTPEIKPPLPIIPSEKSFKILKPGNSDEVCDLETCFDYSRCSLTSGVRIHFYDSKSQDKFCLKMNSILTGSGSLVKSPDTACLYLHMYNPAQSLSHHRSVSHWQGDGRNHIILNLDQKPLDPVHTDRAMIAQPTFSRGLYRPGFDILLPEIVDETRPVWMFYPNMVPITRKYLLSFEGELNLETSSTIHTLTKKIIQILKSIQTEDKTQDEFLLSFSCKTRSFEVSDQDWYLCDDEDRRNEVLEKSTFNLIIVPTDELTLNSRALNRRLYEALRSGNIPVILGTNLVLPFSEVVDWSRFSLVLPRSRITELHYLLRTFTYSDIFNMKRQGRLVFENYFSSTDVVLSTLIGLVQTRLQLPPTQVLDSSSPSVFNSSFRPLLMDSLPPDVEPDESLGPLEAPFPSPDFRRNFSAVFSERWGNWNSRFQALTLFPHTPWEPILPTEAKFLGSSTGFRPISGGEGGSGKEFSQALGGNYPQEQFTVVMLTYERETVLMSSLSRLYGLPYLNKVVVVWNSPKPPHQDLRWPDIGVPIHVVKVEKNSLNNRFLPFSAIETEAILSVDDDSHLRHDEIIFGFRVWRENRDRLVGFPGRFHSWDGNHSSWNYNSNYSCELSMVLTGAAFHHKYYSYLYSQQMPQAIRDMVDDLMNCEDLAMNFLIAHVTRQPPVKVTSRWTFRCPGCPVSLSEDDSHFQERHKCINFFSRVYGYNPLVYTQYRADSVLFKTRIPPDKQKCFKFI